MSEQKNNLKTGTPCKLQQVIAVDFDGVLCEDRYPKIGEPNKDMIEYFKERKKSGDKLILWTCRKGIHLNNAVNWCRSRGLIFDAVNANLPECIAKYRGDTRKVFADLYFDDRNGEYLLHEPDDPKRIVEELPEWIDPYVREDNGLVVYTSAHSRQIKLCLDLINGKTEIVDYGRFEFHDTIHPDERPYNNAMKPLTAQACMDYINTVYPIKLPYHRAENPYKILGSDEFLYCELFYVAGIIKPDGSCIDVNQWFIYNREEHIFTPISIKKRNRIIRKKSKRIIRESRRIK